MERNSQGFVPLSGPPAVPNLDARYNSILYGHQGAANLGAGMSTAPSFYPPSAPFHAPLGYRLDPGIRGTVSGVISTEHERNAIVTSQGYKRKSSEAMLGSSQYPSSTAAVTCSFPQFVTAETIPFSSAQPLDHRNVRNRVGAATTDPLLSHGRNNIIQGNYPAHPFSPPGSIRYDQHHNGNISDGSSSRWPQAALSVPYMHGNIATGPRDSGNVCFPRYHQTPSSRNHTPFVHTGQNYFIHQPATPPPPPTMYPVSASYSHVGPVQSTGIRVNQQLPRDDFVPASTLRHHERPHFRAFRSDEVAVFGEGDFYDDFDYVDHHQDMRLDIDDMSYEELLALSDHIGTVKTGLSEKDVKDLLKRRTSLSTNLGENPSSNLETDSCTICQENYKNRDKIATLDCRHMYHTKCLKKWLVIKNVCPICKSVALVMEKKKVQ